MKTRSLVIFGITALIMTIGLGTFLTLRYSHKLPRLENPMKVIQAARAFAHDETIAGQRVPDFVVLSTLVRRGYLTEEDARAFAGKEASISLPVNPVNAETLPQT